jgi:GNAT superfamily N-acetyltransferase
MSDMQRVLEARAALAVADLAFNPHQRRGPDGRWVKGGGGRPAATPGNAADLVKDGATPETVEQLTRAFTFDDPTSGLRSEVREVSQIGRTLKVIVDIKDDRGVRVGHAIRSIAANPKTGVPAVRHAEFELSPSRRGGGFSARWLAEMEDRYRKAGIGEIGLYTEKVGGHAWAKAGFDFANDQSARKAATRVERQLKKDLRSTSPEVQAEGRRLVARAKTGKAERPLPMEFAMLGWTPGAETWPGKEAMLDSNWDGVKKL